MKTATLGIILDGDNLLLGEKKKGEIGAGVLSGPGGKINPGESPEICLLRETREELEIEIDSNSLFLAARIDFYTGLEIDFRVYVYRAKILSGDLHETDDMIPAWYPISALPFDRMYESDKHWLPRTISGEPFNANVYYRDRAKDFDRIEFLPFQTN